MKNTNKKNEEIFSIIAIYFCVFMILQLISIPFTGMAFYSAANGTIVSIGGILNFYVILILFIICGVHIYKIW